MCHILQIRPVASGFAVLEPPSIPISQPFSHNLTLKWLFSAHFGKKLHEIFALRRSHRTLMYIHKGEGGYTTACLRRPAGGISR